MGSLHNVTIRDIVYCGKNKNANDIYMFVFVDNSSNTTYYFKATKSSEIFQQLKDYHKKELKIIAEYGNEGEFPCNCFRKVKLLQ